MSWINEKSDYFEIVDRIEATRENVRSAARGIRACSDCHQGFTVTRQHKADVDREYQFARKCACLKKYDKAARELMAIKREYEKSQRDEYPFLITSDMTDFRRPTGNKISPEKWEWGKQQIKRLAQGFKSEPCINKEFRGTKRLDEKVCN